jgi:nicotinamidase-related amidase
MDENGRFNQNLITRESVIVIIDAQERLMPAIAQKELILQNIIRILKFAYLQDMPVVITEQEKLGPTLPEIAAEAVGVRPVGKVFFNCFMSGEFEHYLKQYEKKNLILAGVEAHICVSQTALHAIQTFNVHVLADAIGSRTPDNKGIAIERMRRSGIVISSTEMLIYEILQRAGTDKFKSALQLVK